MNSSSKDVVLGGHHLRKCPKCGCEWISGTAIWEMMCPRCERNDKPIVREVDINDYSKEHGIKKLFGEHKDEVKQIYYTKFYKPKSIDTDFGEQIIWEHISCWDKFSLEEDTLIRDLSLAYSYNPKENYWYRANNNKEETIRAKVFSKELIQ